MILKKEKTYDLYIEFSVLFLFFFFFLTDHRSNLMLLYFFCYCFLFACVFFDHEIQGKLLKDGSVLSDQNISNEDFLHVSISENAGMQSNANFVDPPVESGDGMMAGLFICLFVYLSFLFFYYFVYPCTYCFVFFDVLKICLHLS